MMNDEYEHGGITSLALKRITSALPKDNINYLILISVYKVMQLDRQKTSADNLTFHFIHKKWMNTYKQDKKQQVSIIKINVESK